MRAPLPLFVLAVALTAASIVLNVALQHIALPGLLFATVRVVIQALIMVGLWRALGRTDFSARTRPNIWLIIIAPLTAWLLLAEGLALSGVFESVGPLLPAAIILPVIIGLPLLLRWQRLGAVLDAMPARWLIGLQVYRVFGSAFLVAWASGTLTGAFALPAGIGDVLVGLLALPIAVYVGRGQLAAGVAWNLLGILDLVNAVTLDVVSSPGPLQLIVPDAPATVATYPLVLIPAFAVPSSILLHALSLRQLRRQGQHAGAVAAELRSLERMAPA